jgi:hypothetical protein
MIHLSAPPRRPVAVALADDDDLRRVHFRIWQWTMSLLTILATAWFITLGPIPGIIAVVVAKHILVAILVAGLGINARADIDV